MSYICLVLLSCHIFNPLVIADCLVDSFFLFNKEKPLKNTMTYNKQGLLHKV